MANTIHIIIWVITIFILVGSIFLYFRWQPIKARNKLDRKAMGIHIPDFIDSSPSKSDNNVNVPTQKRILCSGQFEMLKNRKNN